VGGTARDARRAPVRQADSGRGRPQAQGRIRVRPEIVFTKAAPKTGFSEGQESPIAQGVKCGDFVFVSGQGPLDPATKQVVSDDSPSRRVSRSTMSAGCWKPPAHRWPTS